MPVLALIYPSPALARLADPLKLAAADDADSPAGSTSVLKRARALVSDALAPIVQGRSGPTDPRWYWAASFLLDDHLSPENIDWLKRSDAIYAWTGVTDHSEVAALGAHVHTALELIEAERDGERSDLGVPPGDLIDVLALSALAGPGNCALRSLARLDGREDALEDYDVRDAAARVAWGLRSLSTRRTQPISFVRERRATGSACSSTRSTAAYRPCWTSTRTSLSNGPASPTSSHRGLCGK